MTDILHNKRFIWIIFISIAIATLMMYILTSLDAGQGNLLMPLDDVYIHFQYARQMALGHPYQYNLIDPATSGATSLIYPYLLTFGYLIGFQGLWLGLWAMILGMIAFIASIWAVYRLCKALDVPQWLSLLTAISFGLTGSIAWHFMSGMETGIVITLTLFMLLFVLEKRLFPFLVVSTLLTITRPEGGLIAAIAAGTLFLRLWQEYGAHEKYPAKRKYLLLLAIPILAFGLQPLVNLLITGTTVATGAQAKSILATVPQNMPLIIGRIWDNFSRMWIEFFTGYDLREGRGWYLPIFTGLIGLLAIPMLLSKKNYRLVGLMLLGWFLILTAAISTLDNAFWHFKRYQMPMLALFFPLAAWVIAAALQRFPKFRYAIYAYCVAIPIFAIALSVQFQHYHSKNVSYVYQQPYQMGIWLRDNTPPDSVVAVHDVGLMRYIGERSTLDMVGLTTPNAAAYWRNGPGSVAEFLMNQQPDYIASYGYGHGYGLAYLADTALYANQLADFTIPDWQPHLNVALAADAQGIYQPDWTVIPYPYHDRPCFSYLCYCSVYSYPFDFDRANWTMFQVTDISLETDYNYSWNSSNSVGFATEVRNLGDLVDTYRVINQYEAFEIPSTTRDGVILVTHIHAQFAGTIDVYANDVYVDTRLVTENPGNIQSITTAIDSQYIGNAEVLRIRIEPNIPNGYYMPLCHSWASYSDMTQDTPYPFNEHWDEPTILARFQDGSFYLTGFELYELVSLNNLYFDPIFYVSERHPEGDYRLFVHIYDDVNLPPIAQWDGYFQRIPIGNWFSGYVRATSNVASYQSRGPFFDLTNIPSGTYQLAIGFYNPNDPTDRLIPESDVYEVTPDGRLWLGEVEIE